MPRASILTAVALCVGLGACAGPVHWQHPNLPREQWSRDQAACRRAAINEVERDLGRDQNYLGRGNESGTDPLKASMIRYDAVKRQNRLIAQCMRALGYTEATGRDE